jgi:hypothetical protein
MKADTLFEREEEIVLEALSKKSPQSDSPLFDYFLDSGVAAQELFVRERTKVLKSRNKV